MDTELLINLFDKLEGLNYVVMRNWRELPRMESLHPDLDIMVWVDDYEAAKALCPEWVDLRTPVDGYFPHEMAYKMLERKRPWKGTYIPSPEDYFLSLYYHMQVHKPPVLHQVYDDELRRAFLEWIRPVEPEDKGVGYYGDIRA